MPSKYRSFLKDPQNIIAIGVTIISLCALIVSLMQTRIMQEERELMREYSRTSVWPRMEWRTYKSHNYDDKKLNEYVISLSNNGIGPAIITDVKISYNGKIANNWWGLFKLQEIPEQINTTISHKNFNGKIFKVGESIEILNLSDNLPLAEEFLKKAEGLQYEIYFESIYKERWKYSSGETIQLDDFIRLSEKEQFK